ncbi:EC1118_1P2_0870p [Saccharomyces cerevisiae EC1118]|uniref:EC1118_1P2_0870p n=1 Tax=Saccharomyces cerevisiae (strain Lalvin EC1118 / Prise de mousse) TaxID=643680 RepID=C8ZII2_YEAS8|nr:EC1118_1P2_0870p [Saccharomyces cerevisiae EC1118]
MKRNIIYYTLRLLPHGIMLVHSLNQFIDEFFTVTERTTSDEMLELSWDTPTTRWVGQLEWPQKVVSLLEVWTNSDDFVNQIVNGQDTILTQVGFDDSIVGQWNSLLVDLTETSLVDQLSNSRVGWVTVSNVWFNQLQ